MNPTTPNKSEGAEKDPIIGVDLAEGTDKTVYVRGHRDDDGVLHITVVSEGAEWEKVRENQHTETWRNDYYGETLVNKMLLAHQRQQAREEGYNAGLADGTGKPLLAIEQVRQQAVAEFAREVVEAGKVHGGWRDQHWYNAITTLLKERGINLD